MGKGQIMSLLKRKLPVILTGFGTGILNGLFGAGGGMVAVPCLQKAGLEEKESHATSIALVLPLSAASAVLYLLAGNVTIGAALPYIPGAIGGALLGAYLMPKLSTNLLRKAFGILVLYSAVRLLLK